MYQVDSRGDEDGCRVRGCSESTPALDDVLVTAKPAEKGALRTRPTDTHDLSAKVAKGGGYRTGRVMRTRQAVSVFFSVGGMGAMAATLHAGLVIEVRASSTFAGVPLRIWS